MAAAEGRERKPLHPFLASGPGVSVPRLLWLLIEGGWRDLARAVARHHGIPLPGKGGDGKPASPHPGAAATNDDVPESGGGPIDSR